ncbi:MAG: PIN domain-containing protein [Pseudonocardiaceae bacterium]
MILVDTGPIVAVINDRDDRHRKCRYLLERLPGPLLIPATVATEVCMMLERRRGTYAELAFRSDVTSRGHPTTRPAQNPATCPISNRMSLGHTIQLTGASRRGSGAAPRRASAAESSGWRCESRSAATRAR